MTSQRGEAVSCTDGKTATASLVRLLKREVVIKYNRMSAPEGHCWLCNKYGRMTKEHIPPESAFNDCPLLLLKVDKRSMEAGALGWMPDQRFGHGMFVRSVCARCNNKCGCKYGGAYVELVRRVANQIGNVQEFHKASILSVKRPLAILKQVLFQFVSVNGPGFVRANEWVAPFVRNPTNQVIPPEIGIYLFASNVRGSRRTGISSHFDLTRNERNILAEFSFWPLGTVISFGHLSHPGLCPVHHWVQYRYNEKRTVDLHLPVNPIHSNYPLDFRSQSQISSGTGQLSESAKMPSDEDAKQLVKDTLRYSGTDGKDCIFSTHPDTLGRIRRSQSRV